MEQAWVDLLDVRSVARWVDSMAPDLENPKVCHLAARRVVLMEHWSELMRESRSAHLLDHSSDSR
jgi:hypothetical protein